ncbi:MAG: hypothetical protein K2W96_09280 [Gemmataceae bacterium]|nr:hypothetical protein [Gemmataceae bacterium]
MNEMLKSARLFLIVFLASLLVLNRAQGACDNLCRYGKVFLSGSSTLGTYCFEVKFDTCYYCYFSRTFPNPGINLCTQDWPQQEGNGCWATATVQERRAPTAPCVNLCLGLYTDNFASARKTTEVVGDWSNSAVNVHLCGWAA